MIILVLNCGSSSIKYQVLDLRCNKHELLAKGLVERIGMAEGDLTHKPAGKTPFEQHLPIADHTTGIRLVLDALTDPEHGVIGSLDELSAVGHRVAHGGEYFADSCIVDQEVKRRIEELFAIAPLHNPANMQGILSIGSVLPGIPQVAVFDTSFHHTIPAVNYMYAIPYEYYERYRVRKYGFHGTSHKYVAAKGAELAGLDLASSRIITCHIGNGGSITAILDGKSIDTSMGLTPTEGLMMGTRAGDIDPGAIAFIMEKDRINTKGISNLINKRSGVLGISGISSDMRDIDAAIAEGNERAKLALDMYIYRIIKYIGAYTAVLDGVDLIVFTGGVGENQQPLRQRVCDHLNYLGVKIDKEVNAASRGEEKLISTPDSKVKVVVIPTDEEMMIAKDTEEIVNKK